MSVVEANQTPPSPEEEPQYTSKFDPESDVNAFGRDPRKETEFWRETAKTVLASDEVKEALASHENNNGDGLTDEQRAYMNFVKELDAEAAAKESKTE